MSARAGRAAWLAAAALLAAGALAGAGLDAQALDWQPGLAWREPWRWWTAAFVHLSGAHLAANLAGCAAVGAFGWTARCTARDTAAWLAAWPATHVLLIAQPALVSYGGLSGVLHAGVAVACVALLTRRRGRERWIGAAVLAGLVAKIVSEQPWSGAVQHWSGWDIAIAPLAHATGAAAGLACAAVALATSPPGGAETMPR